MTPQSLFCLKRQFFSDFRYFFTFYREYQRGTFGFCRIYHYDIVILSHKIGGLSPIRQK